MASTVDTSPPLVTAENNQRLSDCFDKYAADELKLQVRRLNFQKYLYNLEHFKQYILNLYNTKPTKIKNKHTTYFILMAYSFIILDKVWLATINFKTCRLLHIETTISKE